MNKLLQLLILTGLTLSISISASAEGMTAQTASTYTSDAGKFTLSIPKDCLGKLEEQTLGAEPNVQHMFTFVKEKGLTGCSLMYDDFSAKYSKPEPYFKNLQDGVVRILQNGKLVKSENKQVQGFSAYEFQVAGQTPDSNGKTIYFHYLSVFANGRHYLLIAKTDQNQAHLDSADMQKFFSDFKIK